MPSSNYRVHDHGLGGISRYSRWSRGPCRGLQKGARPRTRKTTTREADDRAALYELHAGAFECRDVPTLVPTLADSQECQVVPFDSDSPSYMHHDCMGTVYPDRNLGSRPARCW